MTVIDNTHPYEILIRFGEDGKPRGAHVQRQRIVIMDGEKLKHDVLAPEPLGLNDFPTSDFMTNATRDALASATRLTAENESLKDQLGATQKTLLNLEKTLNGHIAAGHERHGQALEKLADANSRIKELESKPA